MLTAIVLFAVLTVGWTHASDEYAVCNIRPSSKKTSNITGTIYFRQKCATRGRQACYLDIQVNIDNVPLNDGTSKHGLHVHVYGDMSEGCPAMGPHYNPRGALHGDRWNPPYARHVGDWGNVQQDPVTGKVNVRLVDYLAKLTGPEFIIGRGLVLHAKEDDLGVNKNDTGSTGTGNAGDRLACCVIARSAPISDDKFTPYIGFNNTCYEGKCEL